MISPVLRAKFCGPFSRNKVLQLEAEDAEYFSDLIDLGFGSKQLLKRDDINYFIGLGNLAHFCMMDKIIAMMAEEKALELVERENYTCVLNKTYRGPMSRLWCRCLNKVLMGFERFAKTAKFAELDFNVLAELLQKDELQCASEERIFEAVLDYLHRQSCDQAVAASLFHHVRFPFMSTQYLRTEVLHRAGNVYSCLAPMAHEALAIKACTYRQLATSPPALVYLHPRALEPRVFCWPDGGGVQIPEIELDPERRLKVLDQRWDIVSVAVHRGRVCFATQDGSINIHNVSAPRGREILDLGRTRIPAVLCIASFDDWLVTGHCGGQIRAWCVTSKQFVAASRPGIQESDSDVTALAPVGGGRLLSGFGDGSVGLWQLSATSTKAAPARSTFDSWTCFKGAGLPACGVIARQRCVVENSDGSLGIWEFKGALRAGSEGKVGSLATGPGRNAWVAAGCGENGAICVWGAAEAGMAPEALLTGHLARVTALAAAGSRRRFVSACVDGTLRVWGAESADSDCGGGDHGSVGLAGGDGTEGSQIAWSCIAMVHVGSDWPAGNYVSCLAIREALLLGGRGFANPSAESESVAGERGAPVLVWNVETMDYVGSLGEAEEESSVVGLASDGEWVFAAMAREVVAMRWPSNPEVGRPRAGDAAAHCAGRVGEALIGPEEGSTSAVGHCIQ